MKLQPLWLHPSSDSSVVQIQSSHTRYCSEVGTESRLHLMWVLWTAHLQTQLFTRLIQYYFLFTLLLYFLFVFCLPKLSSHASLPFLSYCHRTPTASGFSFSIFSGFLGIFILLLSSNSKTSLTFICYLILKLYSRLRIAWLFLETAQCTQINLFWILLNQSKFGL